MQLSESDKSRIIRCADLAESFLVSADIAARGDLRSDEAYYRQLAEAESASAFFFAGARNDWSRQTFLPPRAAS